MVILNMTCAQCISTLDTLRYKQVFSNEFSAIDALDTILTLQSLYHSISLMNW